MSNYSDLPIIYSEDDYFNFKNYSDAIWKTILESDTPVAMSISWDWWEWKTSLLNLIESNLLKSDKDLDNHLFIKFDAWRFTFSDNLNQIFLNYVLSEIIKSNIINNLSEQDKKTILSSVVSIAKIWWQVLWWIIKEKSWIEVDFSEIISDGGKFIENKLINVKNIREDFELIVNKILEKKWKKFKIIISIDDLDRIDSIKAIEIIEVFKNYLNVKGVFTILVIDQEIINNWLERKFDLKTDKEKDKYKKYFDKIIQIPFVIPNKASYHFKDHSNFLKNILWKYFDILFVKWVKWSILKELFISKDFLKGNPRTIKKYFNIFRLLKNIKSDINDQDLMFISILQDFEEYFDIYENEKIMNKEVDIAWLNKDILNLLYWYEIDKEDYLSIKKLTNLTENNKYTWKEEILKLIKGLDKDIFEPKDLFIYENELKIKFPNNNTFKRKIQQQFLYLKDDWFLKTLWDWTYEINRITEKELLIFVLEEIKKKEYISTSEIIKKLNNYAIWKDAEFINWRNDTYFSQKIRNLIAHWILKEYAESISWTKKEWQKWKINAKWKDYLENKNNI